MTPPRTTPRCLLRATANSSQHGRRSQYACCSPSRSGHTETVTAQDALQVDQGVDGRAMSQSGLRFLHGETTSSVRLATTIVTARGSAVRRMSPNVMVDGAVGSRAKVAPIAPRRPPQVRARVENRYRCCRQPSSAQRRQRQRRMHRFLTRAGARPRCSRFLASLSAVRSCTATKCASYPSRNPRPPLPLPPHHHHQPDTRTRARRGGGSCPFWIPKTTNRSSRQRKSVMAGRGCRGKRIWGA
ncbi:hypothetical protein EDB83DRAFT_439417 [Lactarius deliciosus]|nr:hypothetical protein EDB83DRAFT_439417 [Lactarius deliciosus]